MEVHRCDVSSSFELIFNQVAADETTAAGN
jgi:hypothetical protein